MGIRERTAFTIAGRARVCTGGFGTNDEETIPPEEDGATTGGNSVDVALSGLNHHSEEHKMSAMNWAVGGIWNEPSGDGLEDVLERASVSRDIRRSTSIKR